MKKTFLLALATIATTAIALTPLHANFGRAFPTEKKDNTGTIYIDTLDTDTATLEETDTTEADTTVYDDEKELPWPENVVARIEKIFSGTTIFNTSMVGMKIYDLTADSTIYETNARQLMRPASTLKMMVAVTALDRLGEDYTLKTKLSWTGEVDSLRLDGNIYIKGGFDPTTDNGDVAEFADSIKSLGIDTIHGNVVIDLTMKDEDRLGEGWCWDDDNPVLSPLLVGRKNKFGDAIMKRLRQLNIYVTGYCREGETPTTARTLLCKETPMKTIMKRQLKRSDNLYSEAIFYQIAADVAGRHTASAKHGRQAVNNIISRLGFKPSAYYIADGSGLSLYNYVSPELEVEFLKYAYKHERIYNNLLPCLPIAGEDGTLSKRMRQGAAHGNVKAKTGTVTGVSALAGYLTAKNGHLLCFSIINMGIRHASSGRNFQDKICQALCK